MTRSVRIMLDDLRSYLQMATGLTEATTSKAKEVVTGLLSTGMSLTSKAVPAPEMMGQVQDLADDLVATSKNNRDMLTGMIRTEVDKTVGRMGFVREDELAALRRHVQRLEVQLRDLERAAAPGSMDAPSDAPADAVSGTSAADSTADSSPEAETPAADAPAADAEPVVPKRKKKIIVDPEAGA